MPSYVSVMGEWKAGKEYAVDPKAEKGKEVYEGPDREATKEIQNAGGKMGNNFRLDPDFVMRVKQLGFANVEEYLKFVGYNEKSEQEKFDKLLGLVNDHAEGPRKNAVQDLGGGLDTSGNKKHRAGGFGIPDDVPPAYGKK